MVYFADYVFYGRGAIVLAAVTALVFIVVIRNIYYLRDSPLYRKTKHAYYFLIPLALLFVLFILSGLWIFSEQNQYKVCIDQRDKQEVAFYYDFLKRFPNSTHKEEITSIAYEKALKLNTLQAFKDFVCLSRPDSVYIRKIKIYQDSLFERSPKTMRNYLLYSMPDTLVFCMKINKGGSFESIDAAKGTYLDGIARAKNGAVYELKWYCEDAGIQLKIDTSLNPNPKKYTIFLNLTVTPGNRYHWYSGGSPYEFTSVIFENISLAFIRNKEVCIVRNKKFFAAPQQPSWAGVKSAEAVIIDNISDQLSEWVVKKLKEGETSDFKLPGAGVVTTKSGLQYQVLKQGNGEIPHATDLVKVMYEGSYTDSIVFDQTYKYQNVTFKVNKVIPGWTEILQLMPIGSKWKVYIPAKLAYGEQGLGDVIDPNTDLVFEIELVDIL